MRHVGRQPVVLGDSPVSTPVSDQPAVFQSRQYGTYASALDVHRLVNLGLRERLVVVLGEELEDAIGLGSLLEVECFCELVVELVDADGYV